MSKCFYNATLVLPDRLLKSGWLLVDGEKIARYGSGEPIAAEAEALQIWILTAM